MQENELAMMAAVILGGFIGGERAQNDEKTLKRAFELAFRLKTLAAERAALPVVPAAVLPLPAKV